MILTPVVAFAFGGGELSVEVRVEGHKDPCRISWVRWESEWPWRFTTMEPYSNTTTWDFPLRKLETWLTPRTDVLTAAVLASAVEEQVARAVGVVQSLLGEGPPPVETVHVQEAVMGLSGPVG